ncbi:hypothetical protein J25TS5_57030 [Paenibacillus faecis]|nr:hypothetical protein J25TS5_57030 [Paenibacillus faecis]
MSAKFNATLVAKSQEFSIFLFSHKKKHAYLQEFYGNKVI